MADLKSLAGEWKIVSLEMDGDALPSGGATITIKGKKFTTSAMGAEYSGAVTLDESATPKAFDLKFETGPEKGNTSYGIYELEGDRWRICMTLRGGTRPQKFATAKGSGLALETLERVARGATKAPAAELAGEPAPQLAGEWKMVSVVMSGKPLEHSYVASGVRIATASELQVKVAGQSVLKAKYAISGPEINYLLPNGTIQWGIWNLEGDRLTTCFAQAGQPRPTAFASTAGDGLTLSVWDRA